MEMDREKRGWGEKPWEAMGRQMEEVELSGGFGDSHQVPEACLHLGCRTASSFGRMSPSQGCRFGGQLFPSPWAGGNNCFSRLKVCLISELCSS